MPIPTVAGISPTALKWGAIALIILSLGGSLWWKSNQLESTKKDLVIAEQNVDTLETTLQAERDKAVQREADAVAKQQTIDDLETQKVELSQDFAKTKGELDHILNTVLPNIKTPEDLVAAKETVEQAVPASFGCIEAATGGKPCDK